MCGRFNLTANPRAIADLFGLPEIPELPPRYNIAPSQPIATVGHKADGEHRELTFMRWGLVPDWEKGRHPAGFISARAETVATKSAFRSAFKSRRCLIPANGFYEWRATPGGKQPYHFRLRNGDAFALAGLWTPWHGPERDILSCCILTTDANDLVRPIHDRMPVIHSPVEFGLWLDPAAEKAALQSILRPFPVGEMTAIAVSTLVNSPKNDGPELLLPTSPS
jgi:putative SOS response-associated peptidase YedK